ncbi:MAG: hypothetical protein WCI91_01825 [Candidatus Nomurabacteria bacterium]
MKKENELYESATNLNYFFSQIDAISLKAGMYVVAEISGSYRVLGYEERNIYEILSIEKTSRHLVVTMKFFCSIKSEEMHQFTNLSCFGLFKKNSGEVKQVIVNFTEKNTIYNKEIFKLYLQGEKVMFLKNLTTLRKKIRK